ncbi:MAG: heterodisulfide reductase-related iron-sulfur binding cluster [Syntrophobacterales bacterium]|jgi:heterodisulfide reductase subunit B
MNNQEILEFSFYPGCSVAHTASESSQSLMRVCQVLGFSLTELPDWNCCGSSSAYIVDPNLGLQLSARNLSLADPDHPLLVMCPRCLHHLRHVHGMVKQDRNLQRTLKRRLGRPISPDLQIIHFLEAVVRHGLPRLNGAPVSLNGLRFMPYYGCTLYRPPSLRRQYYFQAEVENVLTALGGEAVTRCLTSRCCGSFLSAVQPEVVTEQVNEIIASAVDAEAECLVTVCAMCQLNLDIRCTLKTRLPIFHFSEILALALGAEDYHRWFARHLVDPRPVLKSRGLID